LHTEIIVRQVCCYDIVPSLWPLLLNCCCTANLYFIVFSVRHMTKQMCHSVFCRHRNHLSISENIKLVQVLVLHFQYESYISAIHILILAHLHNTQYAEHIYITTITTLIPHFRLCITMTVLIRLVAYATAVQLSLSRHFYNM